MGKVTASCLCYSGAIAFGGTLYLAVAFPSSNGILRHGTLGRLQNELWAKSDKVFQKLFVERRILFILLKN